MNYRNTLHYVHCTLVVVGFLIARVRIIFAGDDVTDEDAITALKGMAMTFRIVSSHVRINTTWHNGHGMIDTAFVQIWRFLESIMIYR